MNLERGPVSAAVRRTMERRTELLAYARAIVMDWSLAEDVFQEALVVAIEKGPDLPDDASFGRWMREVIRRVALDALGRRQPAPRARPASWPPSRPRSSRRPGSARTPVGEEPPARRSAVAWTS